jgi:hypothetical protein
MVIITCLFTFLTSLLWGTYIGARTSKAYPSTRIHIPRSSVLLMNCIFTLIAISLSITTPSSDVWAIVWLVALLTGLVVGFFVGRSTYLID